MTTAAPQQKPASRRGVLLAKALVTVALCAVIIWRGNWHAIWSSLTRADPLLIATVFCGMLLGVTISTYKWRLLLSIHGIDFPFGRLHGFYFTSVFFNNFLPSNIGGDVYRIYRTARHRPNRAGAVVAVFSERLTGIWALIALGAAGGTWVYAHSRPAPPWLLPATVTFGVIALLPLIFLPVAGKAAFWFSERRWLPQKLKNVLMLLSDYRTHPLKTCQVIAISFGFHLFTLTWMLVLSVAVGSPSSIPRLVLGIAISNLAALLPVSINGIGLLDGSFIYVMHSLGMDFDPALMMMLLIRALLIPLSIIGGLFYLRARRSIDFNRIKAHNPETIPLSPGKDR